jgi:glycosyltransferase involved in cell wall biosynthesis
MSQGKNGVVAAPDAAVAAIANGAYKSRNGGMAKVDISIVIPTRNEAKNIPVLVRRLEHVLPDARMEILFVDDSDDQTPHEIEQARQWSTREIVLIHRPAERRADGLGGAVIEGLRAASASWVCVMDADLQHPPEVVEKLFAASLLGDTDLVLGSRYRGEGQATTGFGALRSLLSKCSGAAAKILFPHRLRDVTDPMSGLFMVRKNAIPLERLRPRGFKILLEILVRSTALRVREVPFQFGKRYAEESKASFREGLSYLAQLGRLRIGEGALRLVRFGLVGASGIPVNMAAFWLFVGPLGLHYLAAAALATQISTLWLFAFTELWVFRQADHKRSLLGRAGLFFLMNNVALALRSPMLVLLVSVLGVGYLTANLITLLTLTLARYSVADSWIWGGEREVATDRVWGYDIHGLLTVVSQVRLPELERFQVSRSIDQPTLRVRIGRLNRAQSDLVAGLAHLVRHVRYDEGLGRFGFTIEIGMGDSIEVVASPLLRRSPHVLYTNVVEPILRWRFVEHGYSLVHAACVSFGDEAYLVTARTDTGKTTTILKTLEHHRCAFISDDLTLLRSDGQVLTYPKPLTISRHTVKAVRTPLLSLRERTLLFYQSRVHSKSGRQVAQTLARSHLPVATINALVQWIVPPPKYHVDRLIPGVDTAREARLAGLFVIERSDEDSIGPLEGDQALEILMENCADSYGFPPYESIEEFLQGLRGGRSLVGKERDIVGSALDRIPATRLRSSTMDWWRMLPVGTAPDEERAVVPLSAVADAQLT